MTTTDQNPSASPTPPPFASAPPTGPYAVPPIAPRRLLRRRDRAIAGVASGIAEYTGLPTLLVRLAFVVSAFMGWGLLLYPVLWIVVPDERRAG